MNDSQAMCTFFEEGLPLFLQRMSDQEWRTFRDEFVRHLRRLEAANGYQEETQIITDIHKLCLSYPAIRTWFTRNTSLLPLPPKPKSSGETVEGMGSEARPLVQRLQDLQRRAHNLEKG
jgi:hypothetical protein